MGAWHRPQESRLRLRRTFGASYLCKQLAQALRQNARVYFGLFGLPAEIEKGLVCRSILQGSATVLCERGILRVSSLFDPSPADCPHYQAVRQCQDDPYPQARDLMESLWAECGQFVDPSTSERVVQHLPSVFWELYLARALRAHGVSIVRQVRSKAKQKGPDLLADSPKVWIEAMVAGGGDWARCVAIATRIASL